MDVIDAIKKRKSVRKFKNQIVDDKLIKEIIEAARLAPSGCNNQGWKFKVVKTKEEIEKLRNEKIYPQEFTYSAPVHIICCYDPSAYPSKEESEKKSGKGYSDNNITRAIRDLSIASGFITLRAEELGLSSCYIGWIEKEKVKDILNIPKELGVLFSIIIGYADETPNDRGRKDIDEIIIQ